MSFIISQEYLDKLQEFREIEGVYLANSLQQGFIYHALNQGDVDDAYLIQSIWQYNNQLEVNKLQEAWQYAQKKFSSLRLRLAWEEELVQVIDKDGSLDWRYIDLSDEEDCSVQELKIQRLQEKDRLEPYRLEQGNSFRVYLIKQKEDLYTCILSNHHAILDGWSSPILLGYIHETYLKLHDNETISLSIDYSYEEAQAYLQDHKDEHRDYWNRYVSQIEERSDLSGLLSTTSKNKQLRISEYKHITNPQEQTLIIEESLYYRLKELSQAEGVTLNAILQYVWHKVLNIYGNSNQTVVGTIVSGRNLPIDDIESSVGLYINTLPLIVDHETQRVKNVIEAIKDIQDHISEINNRSDINLAKLQKGGKRLFDSLFMYQNYPNITSKKGQNRLKIHFKGTVEKQDYPLSIVAYEENNKIIFILKYAGEIFSKDSIGNVLLATRTILEQIANDPNQAIKNLSYLSQNQYHQIIKSWNQTDKEYPSDMTIHELFEKQVEQIPDNIAVVCNGESITYRDLNKRTNQLGNYLRRLGVKSDTLVAIVAERSLEMIVGLLGVLKAGGAYIPLDSNYPINQLQFILEDTQAPVILTDKNTIDKIPATFAQVISLDEEWDYIEKHSSDNLATCTLPNNLAYVIYTSGTTGKPKGVMIEHLGVVNYIFNISSYVSISLKDKVDFSTNIGFDLTITNTICALCLGAQVIVYHDQLQDLEAYKSHLIKNNINVIKLVPSYFELLIDFISITKINKVILGGEKLSHDLRLKLSNLYSSNKCDFSLVVYDEYGPTETTVGACNNQVYPNNSLTIGKQYYNCKIYVLNNDLKSLPIGAIGELYIGGVGLARGYLNRPELTEERFIANPFQTEEEKKLAKNARLYKTGDLVRWLPDGNLEYIGRNDFQVKIRGYRIELGEIESALSSYEGIRQSVVLVKENANIDGSSSGNKYLVGYYVAKAKLDEENILNYLQTKLPEYMVPSRLVYLEKLPLTINGKLDRNALPEGEFISGDDYVAPRNELESKICQIWADVLGLPEDKVGIRDDFFRLGGDSLLAILLVSKINNKFKSDVKVRDIFSVKTISRLSDLVKNSIGAFVYKDYLINYLDDTNLFKPFPLTNVQQAYYLGRFGNFELGNVSTHGYSEDKFTYLNAERLEKSFNQLIARHLSLRTIFVNGSQQHLRDYPYYKIEVYELANEQELINIRHRLSHKIYNPEVYPLYATTYMIA